MVGTEFSGGEFAAPGDRLLGYHAIDPNIPVGQVPLAQCFELQQEVETQQLGPEGQYDQAWLQTETFMAMIREGNPETGVPFTLQEIRQAKEQAKESFIRIAKDESLPPGLRAQAGLGYASADQHHELAKGKRSMTAKARLPFLKGIRATAKNLLEAENRQSEDDDLLRNMTALAIMVEYGHSDAMYLPAPPRQQWGFTGFTKRKGAIGRISVSDQPDPEIINIGQSALGDDLWGAGQPHATLASYLQMKAGFTDVQRVRQGREARNRLKFEEIKNRFLTNLNAQNDKNIQPPTPEKSTSENEDFGETSRPEVLWYSVLPAGDLAVASSSTLRINTRNLERLQSEGELIPPERYALGWMQIDVGQVLHGEATTKRQEAENLRVQGSRVSRYDSKEYVERAAIAEQKAQDFLYAAGEQFDAALQTLTDATEAYAEKSGTALDILLDIGAIPVYKALFTDLSPEGAADEVQNYTQYIASLAPKMLEAEIQAKRDRGNSERLAAVHVPIARAAFFLLVSGTPDETMRNLALPVGFRSGSKDGETHAVIYPVDYMNNRYDKDQAVNVRFSDGSDITVGRKRLDVGVNLLFAQGSPMPLLKKLSKAARTVKQGAKKHARGPAVDDFARRVADATNDALEL